MKNIFILLSLFFLLNSYAQRTDINDQAFEQALIDLEIDDVIDGSVLTNDINTLKTLDLRRKEISSLEGIQDFVALEILDCNDNSLTTLDITQNTSLTLLSCEANQIGYLDVSKNLALKSLFCGVNNLKSLDVTNNLELRLLDFRYNELSDLDVTKNVLLNNLVCIGNKLKNLNITKNVKLIKLIADENDFTSLNLSENILLDHLSCNDSELTSLDVTKNVRLKKFFCRRSKFERLDLTQNDELDQLYASPNNVLKCIQVKEEILDNIPLNWEKDESANYSIDCGFSAVGLKDFDLSALINVYPNPTSNSISVNSSGDVLTLKSIQIINSSGRVMKKVFESNFDLEGLALGVYYVKIETNRGIVMRKIEKL